MADLSTTYMGISLKNPLVVSPSPLSESLDNLRQMEDSGASAVVMHSVFEEQIRIEEIGLDRNLNQGTETYWESPSNFPDIRDFHMGAEGILELIRKAKEATGIPVLGSLNGVSTGGWIRYAREIEQAGADGLELNTYYIPTDPDVDALAVEDMITGLALEVKRSVKIPVALKLSPYYSSIPNMTKMLDATASTRVLSIVRSAGRRMSLCPCG